GSGREYRHRGVPPEPGLGAALAPGDDRGGRMGAEMNGPGTSRGGHGGPISAGDRVSSVIARDERLIDVFTSLSPAFERLRNPAMRKVMSRLVTVEQAARMDRVDPEELVSRLKAAVGAVASGAGE